MMPRSKAPHRGGGEDEGAVGAAGEAQAYGVTDLVEGDAHEPQARQDDQVPRCEANAASVPEEA